MRRADLIKEIEKERAGLFGGASNGGGKSVFIAGQEKVMELVC